MAFDATTLETPARDTLSQPHYDIPTAITFMIAGLGLGSVLTLLFAPRSDRHGLLRSDVNPHVAR
jgi:hypothetical protein